MNILYIHQYFNTPEESAATRSYWISQELIKDGHQITMITSSSEICEAEIEKQIDGIRVIYLKEPYDQGMSLAKRLKAFFGFVRKSIRVVKKQRGIDLVIATSTPLTVGLIALYVKQFRKIPYIFEVRDLWPEVPIQMGAFKNPFIINAARWLEKKIYRNAEHVVALSPGMQDGVIKYIHPDRVSMIPNMSKIDKFWPRKKDLELMRELGLKKYSFKIVHFGSLGLANGAASIIESARYLENDRTIEFIFIGGGSQEQELKNLCLKYELTNVRFLGHFPMQQTSEIVNFCDISIVSFKDLPILYTNSPNKFFDSLSAGKPIIVNSAGWTKKIVEEYGCGAYVNPGKPGELVSKIRYFQAHPDIVIQMGRKSRELAENKYDKSILCKQFVEVVNGVFK